MLRLLAVAMRQLKRPCIVLFLVIFIQLAVLYSFTNVMVHPVLVHVPAEEGGLVTEADSLSADTDRKTSETAAGSQVVTYAMLQDSDVGRSTGELETATFSEKPVPVITTLNTYVMSRVKSLPGAQAQDEANSRQRTVREPTTDGSTQARLPLRYGRAKPALRVGSACHEPFCIEYLSQEERRMFQDCGRRVTWKRDLTCSCRFLNGTGKKRVALVSLPGSGNTWVRGLLQRSTGICTGSIACDKTLRAERFCGEGIHSSGQLVVKTHDSVLQWKGQHYSKPVKANRPVFDGAVFVVRDPYRAAVAEWNRQLSNKFSTEQTGSNHVKYMDSPSFFGQAISTTVGSNPKWNQFIRKHIGRWKVMMNSFVIKKGSRPIITVWFEDLKLETVREVKRILQFLEYPDDGVDQALREEFNTFYRNHTLLFDPFTPTQKQYYNAIIYEVARAGSKVSKEIGERIENYARL